MYRNGPKQKKKSFEEAARLVRYECYTDLCETHGYTRVALGHNSNDNAEQVLMNLLRGSGTKGLGGIPPVRPLFDKTSSDESNNGHVSASDTTRHGNDDQAAAIERFQVDPSPQNERHPLIIRPLIETSRLEILEWLEEKTAEFCSRQLQHGQPLSAKPCPKRIDSPSGSGIQSIDRRIFESPQSHPYG